METTLIDLKEGGKAQVVRIAGGFGMQQHLASLGVKEGVVVRRVASSEGHGPVMVEMNGDRIAIGKGMAHRIVVTEVEGS